MALATLGRRQKPPRVARLKITELNPHLSCILCGGYFIDATTIIECLHSFCRACIVRYLETSRYCPVCEVQIHKSRPLHCIRSDRTLQDIVYKLVPGLFENEMKKRRELYASLPPEDILKSRDAEDRGEELEKRFIYTPSELFNLSIQYRRGKCPSDNDDVTMEEEEPNDDDGPKRRYLRCPAAVNVEHLKKFIQLKYGIPSSYEVELEYEDHALLDHYTLIDIAYIFEWRRNGSMRLFYKIVEKPKCPPPKPRVCVKGIQRGAIQEQQEGMACNPSSFGSKSDKAPSKSARSSSNFGEDVQKVPKVREKSHSSSNKSSHKGRPPIPTVKIAIAEIAAAERMRSHESSKRRSEKRSSTSKEDSSSGKSSKRSSTSFTAESNKSESHHQTTDNSSSKCMSLSEKEQSPPLKVPKLTIPLTPKILKKMPIPEEVTQQPAEDDKVFSDSDLYEGRLVIAEPDASPRDTDDDRSACVKDLKPPGFGLRGPDPKKSDEDIDDCEVDSGRGSDISSRADVRSLCGDEDIGSPGSSTVRTPDLDKPNPFLIPSPSSVSLPSPSGIQEPGSLDKNELDNKNSNAAIVNGTLPNQGKDDFGVLDLSTCHRKRGFDRIPLPRPKQVANPPVLDKHRQTTPCLPLPKHPSFKLLPAVLPHTSIYKKPEVYRSNFRCRGSTLTVINPDPNSCRPKIVIKNLDPKPDHGHSRHHHHHHHHNHHHQRM